MKILGLEIRRNTGPEVLDKASLASQAVSRSDLAADAALAARGDTLTTFGPGSAAAPAHREEIGPRRWDYQPGTNIQTRPRAYEAVTFEMLRALANNYDIARLAIESRKAESRGFDWEIRPVPIRNLSRDERKQREEDLADDIADLETFWSSPNKEDDFGTWLSMYLEDLFTIDAATLYMRPNRGGGLYGLEIIDGATIKPLIDLWGRPPMPPDPAYAQIIKGVVWGEYGRGQMLYSPYWQRPTSPYGFPPMEWVMLSVNRALRRQTLDLSMFSEGTIPAQWYKVPKEWSDTQLKELQELFDELLSGDDAARSKVRFVPGGEGTGPVAIYQEPKNEIEQWLMHVTASAFGTSAFELGFEPTGSGLGGAGFGEASRESRLARGTKPLARHIERIINQIIAGPLAMPELEFAFKGLEDDENQADRAAADKTYWEIGALSTDEIRDERLDKDPIGLGHMVSGQFVQLVEDLINPPETPAAPVPFTEAQGVAPPDPQDAEGQDDTLDDATADAGGGMPDMEKAALSQWRRKALRAVKDHKDPSRFETDAIAPDKQAIMKVALSRALSAQQVRDVFAKAGASALPLPMSGSPRSAGMSSGTPNISKPSSRRGSMSGRTASWRY